MKGFKVLLVIMAAALVTFGLSGVSFAFHSGGVADCDGCHTMHNAQGTTSMAGNGEGGTSLLNPNPANMFKANNWLLQGSDQSSTCLNCHANVTTGSFTIFSQNISAGSAPYNFTPGGDFGWIATPVPTGSGATYDRRGHNIIAADYTANGFGTVSPTFGTSSPGGAYPSTAFYCSSCHDPHGTYRHTSGNPTSTTDIVSPVFNPAANGVAGATLASGSYGSTTGSGSVGVYRLLAGNNYLPASIASTNATAIFGKNSPIAVVPSSYNSATALTTVAYGTGMAEWCSNCHGNLLAATETTGGMGTGALGSVHPAGATATLNVSTIPNNSNTNLLSIYVNYVSSGNLSGSGSGIPGYSMFVPVEIGATNVPTSASLASLSAVNVSVTASSTANVMCLSCHKAHASAWKNMTRWDMSTSFITSAGAYQQGHGADYKYTTTATASQTATAYNNVVLGSAGALANTQRSLCNKCHGKD